MLTMLNKGVKRMKIYISYFYRIRFFPTNLIPVSTAIYSPKWFTKDGAVFLDKRNVLNGICMRVLSPYMLPYSVRCTKGCIQEPTTCDFLRAYTKYLNSQDFNKIYQRLEKIVDVVQNCLESEEEMDICLMVYEKPDNPCSERGPLTNYFHNHGVNLIEF